MNIQPVKLIAAAAILTLAAYPTHAATIGAQAQLNTIFHNVAGTVTIIDADTFRIDNFSYDGGGPLVYFYLGTENTNAAFASGLRVSPLLTGTAYDGTQPPLFFDLPSGESFSNYNAISVWCEQFAVDFGSGTFNTIQGDLDADGFVGINDLNIILADWNMNSPPANPNADPSGDGFVGIDDLNLVLGNWNSGTPPTASTTTNPIPEPATATTLGYVSLLLLRRR
jgi:electron transfer DM13